jgi:uncharacterized delta-60 repeat protein
MPTTRTAGHTGRWISSRGTCVTRVLLAVVSLAVWCGRAEAAPGDLDPSFGVGGKAMVDVGGSDEVAAVFLQPDGRVVVAGTTTVGGAGDFAVVRFTRDGVLDASFGVEGKRTIDTGGDDAVSAAALDSEGRIVVAGVGGADRVVVSRLTRDGALDPSFGAGGLATADFGGGRYVAGLALKPDGRILVTGNTPDSSRVAVARFMPDGTADASFGANGVATVDFGRVVMAQGAALEPDGAIVVGGAVVDPFTLTYDLAVARLTPEGLADAAFGTGGLATADVRRYDFGRAVALQADGKVVVAGTSSASDLVTGTGSSVDVAVARFTADGVLDVSFGMTGAVAPDVAGSITGAAVAIEPDGRIVVAGNVDLGNYRMDFGVELFTAEGALDAAFGADGVATADFGGDYDHGQTLAVATDGRIVVAGSWSPGFGASSDFAIARFELSPTFRFLAGKRLLARDHVDSERRRVAFVLGDATFQVTGLTPTIDGAEVRLVGPYTGQRDAWPLPAAGWRTRRRGGFEYRDDAGSFGPVVSALVADGRVAVKARGAGIDYVLRGSGPQQSIAVAVTFPAAATKTAICAEFPGMGRRARPDDPRRGIFRSRNAPAPVGCGASP